jgi:hypothetical protein
VTFFQGKTPLLPYLHKNFEKVHQRLQHLVQNLERKFDNMSWSTAIVFGNITSVSEVEHVRYGAKGLRLRNIRGARSHRCGTFLLTKQEKGRKIKTAHRKFKRSFEPKIREVLSGMSLFEQAPGFAANKHLIPMNSQWHHVLRRPSLQDQRRLKFTKQLFRKTKWMYKYTDNLEGVHSSDKTSNQ